MSFVLLVLSISIRVWRDSVWHNQWDIISLSPSPSPSMHGWSVINSAWEKTLCSDSEHFGWLRRIASSKSLSVSVCVCESIRVCECVRVTACTWTQHSHVVYVVCDCACVCHSYWDGPCARSFTAPAPFPSLPVLLTHTPVWVLCLLLLLFLLLFYLSIKMFQSALQVRYNCIYF